jgi:hypothetical protein
MIAFLPVPPKHSFKGPGKTQALKQQQDYNREVLRSIFELIFTRLDEVSEHGRHMLCSDGYTRLCFPVICAWTADYSENINLHSIQSGHCHVCEAPKASFGSAASSPAPRRNFADYFLKLITATNTDVARSTRDAARQYLDDRGVRQTEGVFWALKSLDWVSLLVPDVLHTIYLGILKHLMDWVIPFLEHHNRMDRFNRIWHQMSPYPGFTPFTKPYTAITQWQGKEMRMLGRTLLPLFVSSLLEPSSEQRQPFRDAILCVKSLIYFHLMTKYHNHTDATIGYMEGYLANFHRSKEVFARFRATKSKKKVAEALRKQLSEDLRLGRESEPGWRSLSNAAKTRRIEQDRQTIEFEVQANLSEESDFNFVKMHLLTHFSHHIRQLGHLSNVSSELPEHAMMDIKAAYRISNRNEATEQILRTNTRRDFFAFRNLNHHAQMLRLGDNTTPNKLPAVRKLKGIRTDVKTLSELAAWCGLPKGWLQTLIAWSFKRFSDIPIFVDNDEAFARLGEATYTRYTAAALPVANFQGDEEDVHVVRCTGTEPSRKFKWARNDYVFLRPNQYVEGNFASTRGRIPARLNCLFLAQESKFGVVTPLALVTTLIPGPIRQPSGLLTVQEKPQEDDSTRRRPNFCVGSRYVVPLRLIERAAHLIPYDIADDNNKWFVNNTIDLNAFNLFYD